VGMTYLKSTIKNEFERKALKKKGIYLPDCGAGDIFMKIKEMAKYKNFRTAKPPGSPNLTL
jgi:hypothetical protein